eukprot:CAMPEP_0179102540 /NCGR_PEP_ID=MMETSP0796-20121207/47465_1 /TAXON_ID=73915 /ORGANISM="Pyrodinium bahamense, Strain pbaha01" /LENGTH=125 /DNA_ID=CAMNT_0020800419 /DNA_START=86 /DNA_END=460 /DNA_ORIENTATION=+
MASDRRVDRHSCAVARIDRPGSRNQHLNQSADGNAFTEVLDDRLATAKRLEVGSARPPSSRRSAVADGMARVLARGARASRAFAPPAAVRLFLRGQDAHRSSDEQESHAEHDPARVGHELVLLVE